MKLQKITKNPEAIPSSRNRWYEDACAAAHALDLLGERWSLLVIRELMFGPKRFSDLKADIFGISANILTQRLETLEAAGLLTRHTLPPPAASRVYELTEWGYEAEPIFQALGRFAARSPAHDPTLPFSAASLLLSLRTMLDRGRAGDLALSFDLVLPEPFFGHLDGGELVLARGKAKVADFTIEAKPPLLAAVIYGSVPFAALEAAGDLVLTGNRALAETFVRLFPLPDKAPSADRIATRS